jgi:hypothetical protein
MKNILEVVIVQKHICEELTDESTRQMSLIVQGLIIIPIQVS